jgi:lipoate-protein ligase A
MRFIDLTLPSPAEDLAFDEALLLEAEAGRGGETLRLWERAEPAVVLGSGCRIVDDVDEAACAADGVPILRRASGGGTVLLGRGCLLYSLILDYERSPELGTIRPSYVYILGRIVDGLTAAARQEGISDLAIEGRKFSGTAQQRKSRFLLHHGTLLYDFDLDVVSRYLRPPPRQPEYRAQRTHEQFLCNLSLTGSEIRRRLQAAWNADEETTTWPEDEVRRLVAEKYSSSEWTRRR